MLNIFFGEMPDAIYDTASYFNNVYLDQWLTDDLTARMMKAVDHAVLLGPQAVESKALGVIPVTSISGGLKTLMLIDHLPNMVFNASACGDNCARWILEIARRHSEDITVNLHHVMDFDVGRRRKDFEIRIANTGEVVHSMAELVIPAVLLLKGEAYSGTEREREICQLEIDIPREVLYETKMSRDDAIHFVKRSVALCYYAKKGVSLGYCAEIAGMSKERFIRYLGENQISIFHYDDEAKFMEELNNA